MKMRFLVKYISRFASQWIVFALLLVCAFAANADDAFVLVIDPGHGGKDSGCVGAKAKEKDVVLSVAKLLRDKIEKQYPEEVKVVMTRSTDKFVELQKRAKIANDANGQLFVSVHVNSVSEKSKNRKSVAGAQVYTCGLHRSKDNLDVAIRENSVLELEGDLSGSYHGFDPSSSESYIMFELFQNLHQQRSVRFAQLAQSQLVSHAGRADKDVHQAGFWVLWATAMPAVLVELDFMCNPAQERFLSSAAGQEKCAEALFRAFKEYYKQYGAQSGAKPDSGKKASKGSKSSKTSSKK